MLGHEILHVTIHCYGRFWHSICLYLGKYAKCGWRKNKNISNKMLMIMSVWAKSDLRIRPWFSFLRPWQENVIDLTFSVRFPVISAIIKARILNHFDTELCAILASLITLWRHKRVTISNMKFKTRYNKNWLIFFKHYDVGHTNTHTTPKAQFVLQCQNAYSYLGGYFTTLSISTLYNIYRYNDRWIVSDLEGSVGSLFEVLSQHLPVGTAESKGKHQSG
jgi:hypothetical protein